MATTTTPRQHDALTQADDIRSEPRATDWRRMTNVAHDKIAHRAYELYEERGREPGHDMEDWLKAEHDIEERHASE